MMGREPDLADLNSHMITTVCVGFAYAAFVAPAPLLLLVGLVLSYFGDKFTLLRASACG
jgi:hypothetical protein